MHMWLCVHSDQHKEVLASYEGDVLQLLVKVLTSHPTSAHIQSEAISTVACLADIGKFFHSSQESCLLYATWSRLTYIWYEFVEFMM